MRFYPIKPNKYVAVLHIVQAIFNYELHCCICSAQKREKETSKTVTKENEKESLHQINIR